MRFGASVGIGPFRVYASTSGRRRRKPRKPPVPYMTHEGCQLHHVSQGTLDRCVAKKAAKAAKKAARGPQDAVPPGYR